MPPRKKPTSTRQKKADIQLKRAIKRGDVPAPDPKAKTRKPKTHRRGPTGNLLGSAADPATIASIQAARRLQSAFITLPPKFLEETKHLASTLPLHRPLPDEVTVFTEIFNDTADPNTLQLSCPRRPKWRFDMTKKEVESNEEGLFKIWLEQIDGIVQTWQNHKSAGKQDQENLEASEPAGPEVPLEMPRSPTYFERNLEVWRQLWRVTEISQIILVLLDSRCPLLHFPPSLSHYLLDRKVILVLTKVDISGPARADAWTEYFREQYPTLRVVQVESYVEKEASFGHQGRKQFEPRLPQTFRERLVDAIKEAHTELSQLSDNIKANATWRKKWKPLVKHEIDWDGLLKAGGSQAGSIVSGPAAPTGKEISSDDESYEDREPEFLTIGLIGQPNVGKSSLLNALFGESKVRASKTPGKTKHFQTLFWTPDVRLVDCPGLVMPNFVPMEMQVLCGILPISRVSAVPSCIHLASELMPVERIYKLVHPILSAPPVEDKRTWRAGMKPDSSEGKEKPLVWTAMDILTAYADSKRWVTAKAGRPDVHRAGNAILRSLAEGKVGWAFWPPGTPDEKITAEREQEATGLWIPRATIVEEESEEESDEVESDCGEEDGGHINKDIEEVNDDEDDSDIGDDDGNLASVSRFSALVIDDVGEEENIDDEDEHNSATNEL